MKVEKVKLLELCDAQELFISELRKKVEDISEKSSQKVVSHLFYNFKLF